MTGNNIQAVIFDLGRVLVGIDSDHLLETLLKELAINDIQERILKIKNDPIIIEFECGRIDSQQFYRRICDTYCLDMDFETFKKLWCDIFYTMEDAEELVRRVSEKMPVGLLSDTGPLHWNYIRTKWPWINRIKSPTLSFEVGVMKPNAAIYLAAAQNVQTPPQYCLFIDDLQVNVEGARAVGMEAIRFEGVSALTCDLNSLNVL